MSGDSTDLEKKLRAVRKKLAQIEKLKEKSPSTLDADAREKVASEPTLKAEEQRLVEELAAGGKTVPAAAAPQAAAEPKKKAAPKAAAAPPLEEEPASSGMDTDKRIKAIKKKLQQIVKLKEKLASGTPLDPEAKAKVASEAELQKEMAALEAGEEYVPPAKSDKAASATEEQVEEASPTSDGAGRDDPHATARAQALEPPPADIGLLIDADTEKRFKALQKKLRDIGKLREKDKLDKLQEDKLKQEPGLIEEIAAIQERAAQLVEERRARMSSATAPKAKFEPSSRKSLPAWQCNECGASGGMGDLIGSDGALACNKCGGNFITHNAPGRDDDDDDEGDDADAAAAKSKKNYESKDLKTKRQKQPPPAAKKDDGVMPTPESATWPEIKEVLESGDRGVDKSRVKKAIEINRSKDGAPYDKFDQTLLKCAFLTRIEMRVPPGTLESEAFQLYFPGALQDGLLELILKENALSIVPAGIQQLQRIRSLDLSHNKIQVLPDEDTWESIASTLELLDLSFNKLTSIAPLAPLKKLSQLKVDANQLTSVEGVSWGELKQLTMFSAVGNELASLPEAVGDCAGSLEHLELSENKLTSVPTALVDLKKLKFLNITGNPIKDQKVVKAAEKSIKDLKAYLSKIGGSKGKK